MKLKYNTESFIERSKKVHGDKYDYSKVEYVNSQTKVCVICHEKDENGNEHGEFWVTPNNHLRNRKCPKCKLVDARNRFIKSTEQFIKDAKEVHGNKYDYSKVEYKGAFNLVKIICPIHGEFEQIPHVHLRGCGCQECGNILKDIKAKRTTFDDFVERANKIHNNKYKYKFKDLKSQHEKVIIICPIHGEFEQGIQSHLNGCGCPKCSKYRKKTKEMFIDEARNIHGDKYDYSKVCYKTIKDKITIICPIHGEFEQIPDIHLRGSGCPTCSESHLEKDIRIFFDKNNIEYTYQKTFKWLGKQRLDFYLPKYNIGIECQGIQHFSYKENSKLFNKDMYEITVKRDNIKLKKCKENGVKLLYYSDLGIKYPYYVYENKEKLLEEIKKG